ncbi:MAG: hypothetical protein ACI94Y_004598 [Maribacter sp.]|jgi:hypothetical protein
MNYFKDNYADWELEGYHKSLAFSEFTKFSKEEMKEIALSRMGNLKIVVDVLSEMDILIPESLLVDGKKIRVEKNKAKTYFDSIFNYILINGLKNMSFSIYGKTLIDDTEENTYFNDIIYINFEFVFDLISINVTSDIFQPMDNYGEDLNIERALVNSERLEKCLKEIKKKGIFKNIEPDKGDDMQDGCLQHGFRMFNKELTFKQFRPEVDIEKFDKFIWERRKINNKGKVE